MIDKNVIGAAIIGKLTSQEPAIISNIAYENDGYTPSDSESYALVTVIPAVETPDSTCTERSIFAIDIDIYVEAGQGAYTMRELIKNIGNLYNPLSLSNARWIISGQELSILSVEEVQGAKTEDGWYYSTLRLNLKVSKTYT